MNKVMLFTLCLAIIAAGLMSACEYAEIIGADPLFEQPTVDFPVILPPELPALPPPSADLDDSHRPFDGFLRKKDNSQPQIYMPQEYRDLYDCIVLGSDQQQYVYLTFDAGYEEGLTGQFLDVLQAEGVLAAFFLTGGYIQGNPELVRRMSADGHTLANHSMTHPHIALEADDAVLEQELRGVDQLYAELGVEPSPFFRPPFGSYSERSLALIRHWGYVSVFWSLAYRDWETENQPGADYAHEHVLTNIHPGAVILLHTNSTSNADALPQIIRDIRALGYEFRTLADFLGR